MNPPKHLNAFARALAILLILVSIDSSTTLASDHDDGVTPLKNRNRNITDVYAFREDSQTGDSAHKGNLILIMNSAPHVQPGVQEFFSTRSAYDIRISRVANARINEAPTGKEDFVLRFKFGAPDARNRQPISLTVIRRAPLRGLNLEASAAHPRVDFARTTSLAESNAEQLKINRFRLDGQPIDVFAGLREEPFFFDVAQFFRVRSGALGAISKVNFRTNAQAVDDFKGFNINTIVVRIPTTLLQGASEDGDQDVFDVWETISIEGHQIERLARPAINEGLIVSNDFLNAFNMIPPSADLSAAAAPVRAQAANTLKAFDALDGQRDITFRKISNAFLPDVMRIDTRENIPVGKTAYNTATSGNHGILTGGRKIEDDVIDITLSLLVAGDLTGDSVKDGVSYAGYPGNPNQGHKLLHGQRTRNGPATYPFLAPPN